MLAYPFLKDTDPDKRGRLPVSSFTFCKNAKGIQFSDVCTQIISYPISNSSLTVLEGEGSAELVKGLVDCEEVKKDQAGLHYQGGVRLLILK